MESKVDLIIDTQIVRAHCDRLFSQYEVHYVGQKKIFFYKISSEIHEYEVQSKDLQLLLTKFIDNVIIEGYARVASDGSIEARVKHFQNKGIFYDVCLLIISTITLISSILALQDNKIPYLVFIGVVISMLSLFLIRKSVNSLTVYRLRFIKRNIE